MKATTTKKAAQKVSITKGATKKVADNATSYKVEVLSNNKAVKVQRYSLGNEARLINETDGVTKRAKELLSICQKSKALYGILNEYGQSMYKGSSTGRHSTFAIFKVLHANSATILDLKAGKVTEQDAAQAIAKAIDEKRAKAKATKLAKLVKA